MSEAQPENLTGIWHGLYMYPGAFEPGAFVATIIDVGGGLSGSIHEQSNNDGLPARHLNASVDGRREGESVRFVKQYDGSGGWDHAVFYSGVLSGDRAEIEGVWDVPGEWSGRFLMIRSRGVPDAVRRKAFERA
jgi:hypothetical protein